jgi:hypothetical protein
MTNEKQKENLKRDIAKVESTIAKIRRSADKEPDCMQAYLRKDADALEKMIEAVKRRHWSIAACLIESFDTAVRDMIPWRLLNTIQTHHSKKTGEPKMYELIRRPRRPKQRKLINNYNTRTEESCIMWAGSKVVLFKLDIDHYELAEEIVKRYNNYDGE